VNFFDKIFKKFKGKNAKVLIENFISLSSINVLNLVLPLLVLPHLISSLELERYGLVVLGISLTSYFLTLTDYSFSITGTRLVSLNKSSPKRINYIYSRILFTKFFFLGISSILYFVIVLSVDSLRINYLVFLYSYPILVGYTFNVDWFFQGMEKMKFLTYVSLISKIFFAGAILLFINNKEDYLLHPIINSLSYLIVSLLSNIILFKLFKVQIHYIKFKRLIENIKENFPIFINQFLPNLYNNSSLFLLGVLGGAASLGLLDSIKKIIDICIRIINTFSRVFFPYLNRRHDSFNIYLKFMISIAFIMFFTVLVFNDYIFSYIGISNANSFNILFLLSFGIIFVALYDVFGVNYFIIKRMDSVVMYNTILASMLGAFCCVPAIIYFGAIGAAFTMTIARAVMGLGMTYKYITIKNNF
jgi:PST family polysaccharide transporter